MSGAVDLGALRALHEAAPAGPWKCLPCASWPDMPDIVGPDGKDVEGMGAGELAVAARNALPTLLDAAEMLLVCDKLLKGHIMGVNCKGPRLSDEDVARLDSLRERIG